MIRAKRILIYIVIFSFFGCGYRLIGTGKSSLPSHIKTISIPIFVNKTREPEIEREITRSIRDLFIRDGRLKVVSSGRADTLLSGELRNYNLKPISFDTEDRVTEYRVLVDVEIIFKDLITDNVILKQGLTADDTYKVTSTIASREALERETRRKAFVELAERLRSLVFEGF